MRLIAFSKKSPSKLRKESRPCSARWRCNTSARRRDETSIGTSVSPQPAVTPSPQATHNHPPPLPVPPQDRAAGPKLAMRRRGHHTCLSFLSLLPPHPLSRLPMPHAPQTTNGHRRGRAEKLRPPVHYRCQAFELAASEPPHPRAKAISFLCLAEDRTKRRRGIQGARPHFNHVTTQSDPPPDAPLRGLGPTPMCRPGP